MGCEDVVATIMLGRPTTMLPVLHCLRADDFFSSLHFCWWTMVDRERFQLYRMSFRYYL